MTVHQKSLHQRFLTALREKPQDPGSFPWTSGIENLHTKAQETLLAYMGNLAEDIADHVQMMERVKSTPNDNWRNHWGPQYRKPVKQYSIDVPGNLDIYILKQFQGYKLAHEICSRKDINVFVELTQRKLPFSGDNEWVLSVDLTKAYRESPDAALFRRQARQEKKNAPKA